MKLTTISAILILLAGCSKDSTPTPPVANKEVTRLSLYSDRITMGNKGTALPGYQYSTTGTVAILLKGKNGRSPVGTLRGSSTNAKTFEIQDGDTLIVYKENNQTETFITRTEGLNGAIDISSLPSESEAEARANFNLTLININPATTKLWRAF